jgi:serine/threonine protein kinase
MSLEPGKPNNLEEHFEYALSLEKEALEAYLGSLPNADSEKLKGFLDVRHAADHYFKDAFTHLHLEPDSKAEGPEKEVQGTRIAHFEVIREMGRGGMSRIYAARDTRLNREVALKVIELSEVQNYKEFVRDARTVASLDHENICAVYSTGFTDEDTGYIEMPLYRGKTVRKLMETERLPVKSVVSIMKQAATGLAAAHAAGIVHRDIKPDNLFVEESGRVRILDFGVARMEASVMTTAAGILKGTVPYMSPELFTNPPAGPAADIWALGVTAFEMCQGSQPFTGRGIGDIMTSILNDEPAFTDDTPVQLKSVISRCLQKQPENRFAHARGLVAAMDEHVTTENRTSDLSRNLLFWGILALLLLVLLLIRTLW